MNNVVLEAWKQKVDVVSEIRGGISDDARSTLANVLNNSNNALNDLRAIGAIKNESVCRDTPASQLSGVDWFPEHLIDMVSAIYASQIIDDLVSVQAIDSPVGMIRFLQYVYGQDRGNALRNDVAIDQWGAMTGVAEGRHVACEKVTDEMAGPAVTSGSDSVIDTHLQRLPLRVDANCHIDFKDISAGNTFRAKRDAAGAWKIVTVDAEGYEGNPVAGATLSVFDANSGHIVLTMPAADLAGGNPVAVTYFQDLSYCPTDSMNLELRLKTEMIKAVPHKIRANFAFDASYALSKAHGINVEEALVNACTAEIRQERDNEVINILMRQAGTKSEWDRKVTSYISQHDHDMSFLSELFSCASMINFKTKRGFGNWCVVGRQGLNIIKSAGDRFKSAGATLPNNGAFVAGEVDGLKVIYSPYIPQDAYLVGYKGTDMDAGFVVADFLPITKTDLVMLDDFVGRQGLVSYYGTKMLNPNFYVVGKILHGELSQAAMGA